MKIRDDGVVVITKGEYNKSVKPRRRRRGPKQKRYNRQSFIENCGWDHKVVVKQKVQVIRPHDLVHNNGRLIPDRKGDVAMVVYVRDDLQVVGVAGPRGPEEWKFQEIDRMYEGKRSTG